MSELLFAIGLAIGFASGVFVGWQNAKDKYANCTKGEQDGN